MPNWNAIRQEYLETKISYRKLAAKHNVPLGTLNRIACAEGWKNIREQTDHKVITKTVENIAESGAVINTAVYDAAAELVDAFRESLSAKRSDGPMASSDLREYGSALRAVQMVIASKPTDLDIEEQKARIAKLRKEASDDTQDTEIVVRLAGGVDDYA